MIRLPDLTYFTFQFPVINQTETTSPAHVAGNSYIIAGVGGGWSTYTIGDIAFSDGTAWNLVEPSDGMMVWDLNTSAFYYWETDSWSIFETAAGIASVVADTSPQLGGNLDLNGKGFGDAGDLTKELTLALSGATTAKTMTLSSSHTDDRTLTLPNATDTLVGKATTDILTNKRLTSPKLNEDVAISSTATEVNILDGATLTTAEMNILDGSATTQATVDLVATDGVVISDANDMKQALVSDFGKYVAAETRTFTNKTFDVEGTGNSISNIDTADFKATVIDTDTTLAADSDSRLATQKATKAYADGLLAANDAMVFKGATTIATINALTTYDVGWTYRCTDAGACWGQTVEIGDLMIAVVARTGSGNVNADWTSAQTNIDGAVIGPASATDSGIATYSGTTGKLIQDNTTRITDLFILASNDTDDITEGDAKFVTATDITNLGNLSGSNSGDETTGNLTELTSSVLSITGGTDAVVGSGTTIMVKQASTSVSGYISNTDWNTFNNKVSNVSTSLTIGTRTATTVPINSDGSSPDITLTEADTTYAGLLGSDKWDEIVANTTHKGSNGTDHLYINQDVSSTASPTFVTVTGDLDGNANTADDATNATNVIATANNTTNETVYLTFVDGTTGPQGIETDTGLIYNPSTGDMDLLGITTGTLGLQVGASGTRFTQIHYDSDLKAVIFTQ